MRVLSFPMRLAPGGAMVTVEQGTDDYFAEQVAVLVLTVPGERQLDPTFGAGDLAFGGINPGLIRQQVAEYLPGVVVDDVTATPVSDSTTNVEVVFHTREGL